MPVSADTMRRLHQERGRLASAAVAQMEAELAWFQALDPAARSWVTVLIQAGVSAFVRWLRHPQRSQDLTRGVFDEAPREMTRYVSLQQALTAIRVAVDVVETNVDELSSAADAPALREAVLRFSREVAFSAALVYARVAEERGAWDARLEAHVVDVVVRAEADDQLLSQAMALGWHADRPVVVVAGSAPADDDSMRKVRRAARRESFDLLAGVQGHRLVAVLGGESVVAGLDVVLPAFAPGHVVYGPEVAGLPDASRSAAAALAGLRAAAAWPDAPRPVAAVELLVERLYNGDESARQTLLDEVFAPLSAAGPDVVDTVAAYADCGGSLQLTARRLFVHPNTVRYRLGRAARCCGWSPSDPRQLRVLDGAIALGRLTGGSEPPTPL